MEEIISCLTKKYHPLAILVYGSYATGASTPASDFDALIITDDTRTHDTSLCCGVRLDVFAYPRSWAEALSDFGEVVQVWDAHILLDTDGLGQRLQTGAAAVVAGYEPPSMEAKQEIRAWCCKMLERTRRGDAEGYYRWHWLLNDSLSLYCDMRSRYFFGPGKTLKAMRREDPEGFRLCDAALRDPAALEPWLEHLFAPLG